MYMYRIALSVSDTVCHAPVDNKKIIDLGKVLGFNSSQWETFNAHSLGQELIENPDLYMEHCSMNVMVPLLYAGTLYGYNHLLPVTITSAAGTIIRSSIEKHMGCSKKSFDRVYRGLETVRHGLRSKTNGKGYNANNSLTPISVDAEKVQMLFARAYHGGYNSCCKPGYYTQVTYDYDLKNAYPTAMCLVPDVDWEEPVYKTILKECITMEHFRNPETGEINPFILMAARVEFEFPEDVRFPCIPCLIDDVPFFPQSDGIGDGVYAAGPEIYLALQLGAYVFCHEGIILKARRCYDGTNSQSLRYAVKQLVTDRNKAKVQYGKGSLQELILKLMVNAGYGKIAQNVIPKMKWDSYRGTMTEMGPSQITNPVAACMITSIVRALLLAVQNQIAGIGGNTYSVTTDGFIGDCSHEQLKSLDLYGMRPFVEEARLFLTDGCDAELWETKHMQDDLLNFTTRGNVSLNTGKAPTNASEKEAFEYSNPVFEMAGVCAHGGAKSGFIPDSYSDRLWLMQKVLSRKNGVVSYYEGSTSLKDLLAGKPFCKSTEEKSLKLDYDMKRKPIRDSFERVHVLIEGVDYESVNFDTSPFQNPKEFEEYRKMAQNAKCLRTMQDWDKFFLKIDSPGKKLRIVNSEWKILFDCIMGHRAGLWVIPKLNELAGFERNAWITKHSPRPFTAADWKNAGKPSRQKNILPEEILAEKLAELQAE